MVYVPFLDVDGFWVCQVVWVLASALAGVCECLVSACSVIGIH